MRAWPKLRFSGFSHKRRATPRGPHSSFNYSPSPGIWFELLPATSDAAMSKSFELMRRQMAKKLDVLPEQNLVPCFVRTKRHSYARITRLDLEAATSEEYRKLAENIFRSRGKKSPHVVTFPGIAFRKSRSRMSSHPCGLADALHMKGWIRDFVIPGCPENLWLSSLGSVWHGICQPSSGVARR